MILKCTECEWEFHIKSELIKENGSNVRCSKCGNIWRVYPPEPDMEVLVLENGMIVEVLDDDDPQPDEPMESEDLERLELEADEDLQTDIAEAPETGFDPDSDDDEGELPDLEGLFNFDEEDATDTEIPDGENLLDPDPLGEDELDAIDLSDLEELVKSDTPPLSLKSDSDGEIDFSEPLKLLEEEDGQGSEIDDEPVGEPELTLADDPESEDEDEALPGIEAILKSDDDELFNIDPFLEDDPDPQGRSSESLNPADDKLESDGELEKADEIITKDESQSEKENDAPIVEPEPASVKKGDNRFPVSHGHVKRSQKTQKSKRTPQIGRNKSRRVILAVLAALLLFPGLLAAFYLYSGKDFLPADLIPWTTYIRDHFSSREIYSAGNSEIRLLESTVTDRFLDNHKAGELLVITGQVRNDYDHPRSNIKVTAKLYTENGIVVRRATVYCGNMFSDLELATLEIAAIDHRLSGGPVAPKINQPVGIGKRIPFMVVFHDLPNSFDQYSVEVMESSPMSTHSNIADG